MVHKNSSAEAVSATLLENDWGFKFIFSFIIVIWK